MAEMIESQANNQEGIIGRLIRVVCSAMGLMAGFAFVVEMLLSAASIFLRTTTGRGISGDYELVQMLSAMGIALCLPYCQLEKGHVFVDFFTLKAPAVLKRYLDAIAGVLLSACAFFLAWRVWEGMLELHEYREATMVLDLPIWWGYTPVVPAFIMLGITALYGSYRELSGGNNE